MVTDLRRLVEVGRFSGSNPMRKDYVDPDEYEISHRPRMKVLAKAKQHASPR